MGTIGFWVFVILFGAAFPRTAGCLAKVITFGFILPFMTVAMGSVTYGVLNLAGVDISWPVCAAVFGLPFGLAMAGWIMSED